MKRAYLSIVWGIATTTINGPYETAATAKETAEDEVRENGDTYTHGAVLGPIPIAYLHDEPEVPAALQATSVEQVAEAVDALLKFAVNEAGVPLRDVLSRIDRDLGDWSENLEGEGGMPLTSTFGRLMAEKFRPSELLALYEECDREKQDATDAAKMIYIREAYLQLTGIEL